MNYSVYQISQKQNNRKLSPYNLRPLYRRQQEYLYQIDNSINKQIKNSQSNHSFLKQTNKYDRPPFQKSYKHSTSQISYEYENQPKRREERLDLKIYEDGNAHPTLQRFKHENERRFNAKHMEVESKINKIQSYHNKIQSLLQIVNKKNLTPKKGTDKNQSILPSKSVSKISTPISNSKIPMQKSLSERRRNNRSEVQNKGTNEFQKNSVSRFCPHKYQYQTNNLNLGRNQLNYQKRQGQLERRKQRFNERNIEQSQKRNRRSLINEDEKQIDKKREKSKEYMKSIEGQVKDIQTTIQRLNKKIKQTEGISFRKQINFDDISTSNPQSMGQMKEKKEQTEKNEFGGISIYQRKGRQTRQREQIKKEVENELTINKHQYGNRLESKDYRHEYELRLPHRNNLVQSNEYEASIQSSEQRGIERYDLRRDMASKKYGQRSKKIQTYLGS